METGSAPLYDEMKRLKELSLREKFHWAVSPKLCWTSVLLATLNRSRE